jgi:hypothetical protein
VHPLAQVRPAQRASSPAHQLPALATPSSLAAQAQAQAWQAQAQADAASCAELLALLRRSRCGVKAEWLLERLLQELGDLRAGALTVSQQSDELAVGLLLPCSCVLLASATWLSM